MTYYTTLSLSEKFKVGEWLRANTSRLDGRSLADVGKMISADLNVTVSVSNVRNIAKAIGVSWKKPTNQNAAKNLSVNRADLLAKLVADTFESVGVPVPGSMIMLANGASIADIEKQIEKEHYGNKP